MTKPMQTRLSLGSRQKIYLTLAFLSLFLLFYSVWQVKPIIVEVEDSFGLASHLTPCYWIGLALILLTCIFAFLDRELKKDVLFIFILIALGLFLSGVTVFAYENSRDPSTYDLFSGATKLLAAHHLDISNPPGLGSYYSWPAYYFTTASISSMTGIGFSFVRYGPLFWTLCFVFITYAIGKRFELAPNRCFLLSLLGLSSYGAYFNYHPRGLGIILFLLLFMLLLTPRRTVAETMTTMLVFSALMLTHSFTSLVVLPALILLAIYRKESRFVAPFIVIFGAWYMYQTFLALEVGVSQWLAHPFFNILQMGRMETYQVPSAAARAVSRYSQLSYLTLYALLMIASVILLLMRKTAGEPKRQVISLFCWMIGITLLLSSQITEAALRTYMFCLVPMTCIILLSFSSRRLIVALMCLCIALHMPAYHGVEASWGQVLTSELKGTEFFALEVKPRDSYYYSYTAHLVIYHNPDLVTIPNSHYGSLASSPGEADLSALDRLHYVIFSRQATSSIVFNWGEDPYKDWLQTEAGRKADLVYNNGYFQIYVNRLAE